MSQTLRIVHYVNQFFGGLGGEDQADTAVQVRQGPVGPGRALQQVLKGHGAVMATIISVNPDGWAVADEGRPLWAVREHVREAERLRRRAPPAAADGTGERGG